MGAAQGSGGACYAQGAGEFEAAGDGQSESAVKRVAGTGRVYCFHAEHGHFTRLGAESPNQALPTQGDDNKRDMPTQYFGSGLHVALAGKLAGEFCRSNQVVGMGKQLHRPLVRRTGIQNGRDSSPSCNLCQCD